MSHGHLSSQLFIPVTIQNFSRRQTNEERSCLEVKYLIVGPAWVGDMIMAQTLFITLKQQNPKATIDVLASNLNAHILQRMPEIRNCIEMPLGHGKLGFSMRRSIGLDLRGEHYSQAIVLPNSFKSALVPFWAKIPIRTGWRGEMRYGLLNDLRTLNKKQMPLMAERFVALGHPKQKSKPFLLPKPKLHIEPANANNALHFHKLNTKRPIVAFCPGAEFGSSKQWPAAYYSEVAINMIQSGWQIWLFGAEKDKLITTEIISNIPKQNQQNSYNLAGKTSLADAMDLMSLTNAVVSNDSGLMHIAAALSRPTVTIYGSTTATHTPPMNNNSKTLCLDLECSPCFKRECPLMHHNCMKQLKPHMVMSALNQLCTEKGQIAPVFVKK